MNNATLTCLAKLEREHDVVELFAFGRTTSWVALKNFLFERSVDHLSFSKLQSREFLSLRGATFFLRSLFHYFMLIAGRTKGPAFFGAGSGIFDYHGEVLDSYLPTVLEHRSGIPRSGLHYFLSATRLSAFEQYSDYLTDHQAIIFSLLGAPLRSAIYCVLRPFLPILNARLNKNAALVSQVLRAHGLAIPANQIVRIHVRFAAGYVAYAGLLALIRITDAYIVSAYSYSEIVAALRRKGCNVTEVQHGLIGSMHRGYNYAVKSRRLPVPNRVQVYNNFWRSELVEAGFFGQDAIEVGRRLKYALAEAEAEVVRAPYILFSGQGLLKEEVKFIRDFASTDTKLHLLAVPHPIQSKEDVSILCEAAGRDPRIHILAQKNCTTERLIMSSIAHISIFSSCHFDALHYKGRTFVLDVIDQNIMHHYASLHPQEITLVSSAQEILAKIQA